jgi:hypothetical protein
MPPSLNAFNGAGHASISSQIGPSITAVSFSAFIRASASSQEVAQMSKHHRWAPFSVSKV